MNTFVTAARSVPGYADLPVITSDFRFAISVATRIAAYTGLRCKVRRRHILARPFWCVSLVGDGDA